jgi:predicted DNA binding CopG/RHH family protein
MKKIVLDEYEQEIEDAIANGEYSSVSKDELKKTKQIFVEAAKNYFEIKKSKSITIRVKNEDLLTVKSKAKGVGIPYQRIINMLINGYANNRIKLAI